MNRIDTHVHLAGNGAGGSGCHVSRQMARSIQYRFMRALPDIGRTDQEFADRLVFLANSTTALDFVCVFAMDGVYDVRGEFLPDQSHLYVPNSYAIEVASRSPKLLPVISINPQRAGADEELARYGPQAVALKWLPSAQHFDPSNPRYDSFRELLRDLGLPVICHSGTEHTLPNAAQRLGNPLLCEPLLKLGIPVIFAHCATCTIFQPGTNYLPAFRNLLERYDCAYGDTAGFCSLVRFRHVYRFSADRYIGRIVHGSDYPVPTNAVYFWRKLGLETVRTLGGIRNPLEKDAAIKRAAGMPEDSFTTAYKLLEAGIHKISKLPNRKEGKFTP